MSSSRPLRLVTWTLGALLLLLAWDALGLDLPLARLAGTRDGFPLRETWLMSAVLHEGARRASWLLMAALILSIWWPVGVLRQLTRGERAGIVAGTVLALLSVSLLKSVSRTSCPWDLMEFGGMAPYVSHWNFGVSDGGGGRCFPAGHASAGFAFVAGYFWLQDKAPRTANTWLLIVTTAGLGLGLAQQWRGAHYLSHTLWTAWVCWTTAGLAWGASQALAARRKRRTQNMPASDLPA
jgi:membrane-associated PAP2 superfamily phosphatase